MNSLLNINIRANNQTAAPLRQVQGSIDAVGRAAQRTSALMQRVAIHDAFRRLESFGKNVQWTGRQIEYRFTLPLIIAGGAATKWAMDNERATTQVRKVYGDLGMSTQQVNREVAILGRGMRALSDIFGVQQSEVIGIEAAWAQAGQSGIALAKSVRLTMETMLLGQLDAETASRALIGMSVGLQQNTNELRKSLEILNVVENETSAEFKDLIEVFYRAGGAALTAGVDVRHLAALTAALVPAAGTAAQVGNAFKSIFSRLLTPTKQAADVLKMMGINVLDLSWRSKNAADRLVFMANAFQKLNANQKAMVSSLVATRYQVSRFDILMRGLASNTNMYDKALKASSDANRNAAIYAKELGIVLASQPQAFKIAMTRLQNLLAEIIMPLVPAFVAVAQEVVKVVQAFADLDPATQKLIMGGMALIAILGPIFGYFGTLAALVGRLGAAFTWFFTLQTKQVGNAVIAIRGYAVLWDHTFGAIGRGARAAYEGVTSLISVLAKYARMAVSPTYRAELERAKEVERLAQLQEEQRLKDAYDLKEFRRLKRQKRDIEELAKFREAVAQEQIEDAQKSAAVAEGASERVQSAAKETAAVQAEAAQQAASAQKEASRAATEAVVQDASKVAVAAPGTDLVPFVRSNEQMVNEFVRAWALGLGKVRGFMVEFGTSVVSLARGANAEVMAVWGSLPAYFAAVAESMGMTWAELLAMMAGDAAMTSTFIRRVFAETYGELAAQLALMEAMERTFIGVGGNRTIDVSSTVVSERRALEVGQAHAAAAKEASAAWRAAGASMGATADQTAAAQVSAARWASGVQVEGAQAAGAAATASSAAATRGLGSVARGFSGWAMALSAALALVGLSGDQAFNKIALSASFAIPLLDIFGRSAFSALGKFKASRAASAALGGVTTSAGGAATAMGGLGSSAGGASGAVAGVGTAAGGAGVALGGWIAIAVAAAAAVGVLGYVFRKQLGEAARWVYEKLKPIPRFVAEVWASLPRTLTAPVNAVISLIATMAKTVYKWLSYLNPFARHSPSLVEQVNAGVDLIARKYASLAGIGTIFRRAANDLKAFGQATAAAQRAAWMADIAEKRKATVSAAPNAGPAFDAVVAGISRLRPVLEAIGREFAAQERVVARWKIRLDAATESVEAAQRVLDDLTKTADRLRDALDEAQGKLDKLADTPITGMRAMSNAIFENEIAQKRLRLEMMRLEDATGPIDDIKDRMAALQGLIETLRGQSNELRLAGAGSDVTGPLDAQVRALEAQRRTMGAPIGEINALQSQLDELQREGERLELIQSITFDPLTRQIDQLVNGMEEMPFDQIYSQIVDQQRVVADLTTQWEAADAAVQRQQATVDVLVDAREAIQRAYDAEQKKLDALGEAYDAVEQRIRDMQDALDQFAATAEKAKKAAGAGGGGGSALADAFGAGGDFPVPLGSGAFGKEAGNLDDLIKQWEEESKKAFGKKSIFDPLKKTWKKFTSWFSKDGFKGLGRAFSDGFKGIGRFFNKLFSGNGDLAKTLRSFRDLYIEIWKTISDVVVTWANTIERYIKFIGPIVGGVIRVVVGAFRLATGAIDEADESFGALRGVVMILGSAFRAFLAVIRAVATQLRGAVKIFRGWYDILWGFVTFDFKKISEGIKTLGSGIFDVLTGFLRNVIPIIPKVVIGILAGAARLGAAAFAAAFMLIFVKIPNAVKSWWRDNWPKIWMSVVGFIKSLPSRVKNAFVEFGRSIMRAIGEGIRGAVRWLIDAYNRAISWLPSFLRSRLGLKAESDAHEAGKRIVKNGLADGLTSELPKLKEATRRATRIVEDEWGRRLKGTSGLARDAMEAQVNEILEADAKGARTVASKGGKTVKEVVRVWKYGYLDMGGISEGFIKRMSSVAEDGITRMKEDIERAVPDVDQALSQLGAGATPQQFIGALNAHETAITNFQDKIQQIIKSGNPKLAAKIASLGPEAGTALATAFVKQGPGIQSSAEQALGRVTKAVEAARRKLWMEAPAFGYAAQAIAAEVTKRYGINFDLSTVTNAQIAKAQASLTIAPLPDVAFTQGGEITKKFKDALAINDVAADKVRLATILFQTNRSLPEGARLVSGKMAQQFGVFLRLAGVSEEKIAAAVAVFRGDRSAPTAAQVKGAEIARKYRDALVLAGVTDAQIVKAVARFRDDKELAKKAKNLGWTSEQKFGAALALEGATRKQLDAAARKIGERGGSLVANARTKGEEVSGAFEQGLNSWSDRWWAWGFNVITQVNNGARAAGKARSPSRVWMRLGADLTDGLALGIEAGTPAAVRAARRMVLEVSGAARKGISSVELPGVTIEGGKVRSGVTSSHVDGSKSSGSSATVTKNYTFTGDLSFPNIKNAADAEKFLRNLETLVD